VSGLKTAEFVAGVNRKFLLKSAGFAASLQNDKSCEIIFG